MSYWYKKDLMSLKGDGVLGGLQYEVRSKFNTRGVNGDYARLGNLQRGGSAVGNRWMAGMATSVLALLDMLKVLYVGRYVMIL